MYCVCITFSRRWRTWWIWSVATFCCHQVRRRR